MRVTLGEYIARAGLTHAEFAGECGVERSVVTRYLLGTRKPGRDAALAIERATKGAITAESWSRRKRKAA